MNTPDQTMQILKKWIDNPESVAQAELNQAHANSREAFYYAADDVTRDVAYIAYTAFSFAFSFAIDDVNFWLNEYEKLAQKEAK